MGVSQEATHQDNQGFGNEPIHSRYVNGGVIDDGDDTNDHGYATLDDHYAAAVRLVDAGVATMADATKQVGYDASLYESDNDDAQATELASEVGVVERIVTVEQRYGFLPRSRRELSDIYDLISKDNIAGADSHLNLVLNRQKKHMKDPSQAVRSIVSRYAAYAKEAHAELSFLQQVKESMSDSEGLDTTRLDANWQYEGSVARPLMHTLWSHDVTAFVRDAEGKDPLRGMKDGDYALSNKLAIDNVNAYLSKGRPSEFNEEFIHSVNSEKNRYDFWVNTLQESRRRDAASGVAYRALVDLGVIKDETR